MSLEAASMSLSAVHVSMCLTGKQGSDKRKSSADVDPNLAKAKLIL